MNSTLRIYDLEEIAGIGRSDALQVTRGQSSFILSFSAVNYCIDFLSSLHPK